MPLPLPKSLRALLPAYFLASLAHFSHNAEFIAVYPNLPAGLTRDGIYLAWLAVTGVGAAGIAAMRLDWPALGALLLAAYGALGLGGLAHYTLALCSEHTFTANLTIWAEVVSGLGLLLTAGVLACRQLARHLPTGARRY